MYICYISGFLYIFTDKAPSVILNLFTRYIYTFRSSTKSTEILCTSLLNI